MPSVEVRIRSGRHGAKRLLVDRPLVIGRAGADIILDDSQVSRRHALLRPADGEVVVEDLGSTNGTALNGEPLSAPAPLAPGDRIIIGTTVIDVIASDPEADSDAIRLPARPATASAASAPPTAPAAITPVVAPSPGPPGFAELRADGALIAYRPGSMGASLAPDFGVAVTSARRRLKPLIDVAGDVHARVLLVDPFPDTSTPGQLVTRGSVVDAGRFEIWTVVTAEAPPEPPERELALLIGSRLPAAAELGSLLEGWGMHAARAPDPDPYLRQLELPTLADADGELRPVMARSFVAFLLAQQGEQAFLRFLASASPGGVDDAARATFGESLAELEQRWRDALRGAAPSVPRASFVRLALRYLRPYWLREVELLLLTLLTLAFTVALPFAMKSLLDTAIPSGDFSEVTRILGILAVAFAVTLVASLRQTYQIAYVGSSIIRDIRLQMFERLQALEPAWFSARGSGDVLARVVSDVEVLEAGLSQSMRQLLVQLLTLIVTAVTLVILDPLLAAIVLAGAPVVGLIYYAMGAGAQRRSLETQQLMGEVTSVTSENLGAQPVVKAFGLERHELGRLEDSSHRLFRSEIRLHLFSGLFGVSVEMVTTLLRLVVLGLGAYLVIHGKLTIGGLVAFTTVMSQVLAPVTMLSTIAQQIQISTGALVRINEVLEAVPEVSDAHGAKPLARLGRSLELRDVSFAYTPERRVLHGVSAVIPSGARVAFVGPSGAGKSSIVQLLVRFADPDEGAVLLDGVDVKTGTLASLRGQIGVVLQETFLFNASIRENIALGRVGAGDAEIEAAGRAARLADFVAGLPDGWDTVVGERGGQLSGGQRQRVAIARALLRDPAILILDEATSALDPRTEHEITTTLDEAAAGRTTVAITHRLASIRGYDHIFVIVDGRLVEQGTHEELLAERGTYAELWEEQHGSATPAARGLDVKAALARLPLFAELSTHDLDSVEAELRPLQLADGEQLPEGGGRLMLVAQGTALAMVPAAGGGELVQVAELRPGQAFGLSALLGGESGAMLEADGPLSLLVLDREALRRLVGRLPEVGAALAGRSMGSPAPSGVRLDRPSAVMDRAALVSLTPSVAPGDRAASGVHPVLPQGSSIARPPPEVRR